MTEVGSAVRTGLLQMVRTADPTTNEAPVEISRGFSLCNDVFEISRQHAEFARQREA